MTPRKPTRRALLTRAARVRILLMDVDGVLTDGRYWSVPDANGAPVEAKLFDSQDGLALQWLRQLGYRTGLISGRVSQATEERARQAGFTWCFQGHLEKIPLLERILAEAEVDGSQAAYIGDDFTDVVVMHRVGLAIATGNARPEVKRAAHHVTRAPGGHGAVREAVELILQAQGRWGEILGRYELGAPRRGSAHMVRSKT
jgi:3-deoxy-D-manno-octulosonate 8-phosphate phosphatase (KDO 8-P phosphatase)